MFLFDMHEKKCSERFTVTVSAKIKAGSKIKKSELFNL